MNYTRNSNPHFWKKHRTDCNCGSFALNVTSWFTPYDNNDEYTDESRSGLIQDMYDEGFDIDTIQNAVIELDTEEILRECPWLEPISMDEAAAADRVVSYRLYIDAEALEYGEVDEDYHFRVRINGFWFEKCGQDPIRFCGTDTEEDPWETSPYLVYDSAIKYFRFKEI